MGKGKSRRRGEPLIALLLLLTVWTGARMLLWQSPFPSPFDSATAAPARASRATIDPGREAEAPRFAAKYASVSLPPQNLPGTRPNMRAKATPFGVTERRQPAWQPGSGAVVESPASSYLVEARSDRLVVPPGIALPQQKPGRWQVSSWIAWRARSGLPQLANGARAASYGGTQAGAVARFDLASGGHRPALHVRTTYAPDRPSQTEIAAGASLRPLARLPLRMMAEARVTRSQGRTEVRPAVLAVTELAPVGLPLGLAAEGYAQGGWVGGRNATAFADGQARVTRQFALAGTAQIRVGAGAWGGVQKFAERVDVGPTIALDLDAGPVAARLSLDYRMQVAGNARPGDGPALTLSTGF